ncbi:MAG TPA: hypothetical protein VF271_11710 [Rhodanobacteraceae bacterium]
MRYAMCCVALSWLWSLAAVAGNAGGRIAFVGKVVTPTCSTVTQVIRAGPVATAASRECGIIRHGQFVPYTHFRVRTRSVSARHWLPSARILRLLGQPESLADRHIQLKTRSYQ